MTGDISTDAVLIGILVVAMFVGGGAGILYGRDMQAVEYGLHPIVGDVSSVVMLRGIDLMVAR